MTASPSPSRNAVRDGVGEPAARLVADDEPIDDDEQLLREGDVDVLDRELVEMLDDAVDGDAHEALRAEVLDDDLVRDLVGELAAARRRRSACRPGSASTVSVTDCTVSGLELASALRADRVADARPEQAQVVVDLRRRADGGARRLGRVLLLDGDGGGEPVDVVDVGLLHALEELPRVRGERLDVAPLALGVDRVEGERGLARAGRPRDDREGAPRDLEVEALEVVLPRAADDDPVLHGVEI